MSTPQEKALMMIKDAASPPGTYKKGGKTYYVKGMTPKEAGFGVERRKKVNWAKLAELALKD